MTIRSSQSDDGPDDRDASGARWKAGDFRLPVDRYIDPDFARLEAEKFWPHVWQMACRLDQVKAIGSYHVYDIGRESILIVRVDKDRVKAYHNVCPHRATALAVGSGRFQLKTITCPFHGWKWTLDGACSFAMDRPEFMAGTLDDAYLALHECQVATWMGSVWINLDRDAPPFEAHIAPIRALIDPLLIDRMQFYWHKSARVPANWKVTQEAFMEAYHVAGTHPQILRTDENIKDYNAGIHYAAYPNGHGIFELKVAARMGDVSEEEKQAVDLAGQLRNFAFTMRQTYDQHDAMVLQEEVDLAEHMAARGLPDGASIGGEFVRLVQEMYDAEDRPMGSPEALSAVSDCHIFPNVTFLPLFGNVLMYRTRPTRDNDPDWCIFDMYSLRTYPADAEPPEWRTDTCDDLSSSEHYRLVPRQDFSNIPRQQQGMHSSAMDAVILNGRQEVIIMNMHRELDRYLER